MNKNAMHLHVLVLVQHCITRTCTSTVPIVPVILYRYMYTSSGARATFRHHARAEEALQHFSLIATEELTELLKPGSTVPLYQYIPL